MTTTTDTPRDKVLRYYAQCTAFSDQFPEVAWSAGTFDYDEAVSEARFLAETRSLAHESGVAYANVWSIPYYKAWATHSRILTVKADQGQVVQES